MTTPLSPALVSSAARPRARFIIVLLFAWQFGITALGAAGALSPERSSTWLRTLLIIALIVSTLLVVSLLTNQPMRPRLPLAACYGLTAIVLGVIYRITGDADLDVIVAVDNCLRLGLPLLIALGVGSAPQLFDDIIAEVRHRALFVDLAAMTTLATIVVGRAKGWGGSWLTGDPLLPLLALPVVLKDGRIDGRRLMLYLAVIALSGKRWALVCWIFILLAYLITARRHLLRNIGLVAGTSAAVAIALSATGVLTAVVTRVDSSLALLESRQLRTATSITTADASTGQRLEEIRLELDAWTSSPGTVVFGRNFEDIQLRNGGETHAIHATPLSLLARGGLVWLLALWSVRGKRGMRCPEVRLAAWLILLESMASNNTLDPTFGCALAIIAGGRRRDQGRG